MTPKRTALCPWLLDPDHGTLTLRGRARFPEGRARPTSTDPGELTIGLRETTGTLPVGDFVWEGEAFAVRFERFPRQLLSYAGDIVTNAFLDEGHAAFRIDSFMLEAPAELGEREQIGGAGVDVISVEGRPVRVQVELGHEEDLLAAAAGFRAVFSSHAELGLWEPLDVHHDARTPTAYTAAVRLVGGGS